MTSEAGFERSEQAGGANGGANDSQFRLAVQGSASSARGLLRRSPCPRVFGHARSGLGDPGQFVTKIEVSRQCVRSAPLRRSRQLPTRLTWPCPASTHSGRPLVTLWTTTGERRRTGRQKPGHRPIHRAPSTFFRRRRRLRPGRKSSLTLHPLADRVSDLAICSHLPLVPSSTPPRFRLHTYASRRSRSAQLKIENRTEGRWEAAVAVTVSIARGHDACYPFTAVGAADGATVADEHRTDYYLSAAEQAGESAGSLGWRRRHRVWLPRQGHGAAPGLCRAVARLAALLAPRRGGNAARPRANRPARGTDTEARTGPRRDPRAGLAWLPGRRPSHGELTHAQEAAAMAARRAHARRHVRRGLARSWCAALLTSQVGTGRRRVDPARYADAVDPEQRLAGANARDHSPLPRSERRDHRPAEQGGGVT
jgi:hypothetical protein